MKMKIVSGVVLGLFLLVGTITAQTSIPSICIDNQSLNITELRCIDGLCKANSIIQYCPNGCDSITNACSPDQFNATLITIAIAAAFIIAIALIAWRIR